MAITEKMLKFTEVMKPKMDSVDATNELMLGFDKIFAPTQKRVLELQSKYASLAELSVE